jgi:hypothetical protein
MKSQYIRQLETLVRVRAFGEAHSDLFPPSSLSGKTFGVIAGAIPTLRDNAGSQAAGRSVKEEGLTLKTEAREALREWIVDISRTARAIGREHPEVASKFRLPSRIGDEALLEGARAFARNAAPLEDTFVAHELPPTFLQDLGAAIARFESVSKEQTDNRGVQIRATASLADCMDKAMDALYRLDGMVPNKIKRNPTLEHEWEVARRLPSARSSKRTKEDPGPPDGPAKAAAA